MKKLLFKRNYKYILFFVFLVLVSIIFGNTRIISYNFGKYFTTIEVSQNNIDNSIEIFDEEIVHEIKLSLSLEDYENLILYYKENDEKEYFKTDIVIDQTEIKDIGVKLKGNKILLGNIEDLDISEVNFSFFIKFDKYITGQSYLGNSEISIISGSLTELKGEYIASKIFEKYSIVSPKSSFVKLNIGDFMFGDYLIKQVVNEDFIEENYMDTNGLVYKAENSLSFTYLSEDPAAYSDLFTQKTLVNNYDLKKLIEVLDFVSNSSDEKFKYQFTKYIDIENYTKFLAINNILYSENEKIDLLNSYYIYYNLETETIGFIPWDSQYLLDFEETSLYEVLHKVYSKQEIVDLSKKDVREILDNFTGNDYAKLKKKYVNDLEKQFLSEDGFEDLYEEVKQEIEDDLITSDYIANLEQNLNNLLIN